MARTPNKFSPTIWHLSLPGSLLVFISNISSRTDIISSTGDRTYYRTSVSISHVVYPVLSTAKQINVNVRVVTGLSLLCSCLSLVLVMNVAVFAIVAVVVLDVDMAVVNVVVFVVVAIDVLVVTWDVAVRVHVHRGRQRCHQCGRGGAACQRGCRERRRDWVETLTVVVEVATITLRVGN